MAATNTGINFNKHFGTPAADGAKQDLPKAEFWINIGYESDSVDEHGTHRFVSLPMGLPLDTMKLVETKSSNAGWAEFQAAKNDLHAQIMEAAKSLKAGDAVNLNLTIQLRRVADAAVPGTDLGIAKKLNLVG